MAFLPPEALGLCHGDTLQPDAVQRILHVIQLERLDDRFNLFHLCRHPLLLRASSPDHVAVRHLSLF